MKAKVKVLLGCLLTAFAVGCSKDSDMQRCSNGVTDESVIHITYVVNGDEFHVSIVDQNSWTLLVRQLVSLSSRGCCIEIFRGDVPHVFFSPKDVVEYSTKDLDAFFKWVKSMLVEGYDVKFVFDEETGMYYGTATKI